MLYCYIEAQQSGLLSNAAYCYIEAQQSGLLSNVSVVFDGDKPVGTPYQKRLARP